MEKKYYIFLMLSISTASYAMQMDDFFNNDKKEEVCSLTQRVLKRINNLREEAKEKERCNNENDQYYKVVQNYGGITSVKLINPEDKKTVSLKNETNRSIVDQKAKL